MIYDGKEAAIKMQEELRKDVEKLGRSPVLAIISVDAQPSAVSFIHTKRKFAEAIGITIKEFDLPKEDNEVALVAKVLDLAESGTYDGIVVQLPLPPSYDEVRVLEAIPPKLDVDVLNSHSIASFEQTGFPIPPVAGAVAHILKDSETNPADKNVVIVGQGKLVGQPVTTWFKRQGVTPLVVDVHTDEGTRAALLKNADIVVTGVGVPSMLHAEDFKSGVILIDAGTSEQGSVLSGDCAPDCADVASVCTPVPGGVGPLTVAHLFKNLIAAAGR